LLPAQRETDRSRTLSGSARVFIVESLIELTWPRVGRGISNVDILLNLLDVVL